MLPPKNWRPEGVLRLTVTVMVLWLLAAALVSVLAAARKQQGAELPPLALLVLMGLAVHGTGLLALGIFLRAERRPVRDAFGLALAPGRAVALAAGATLGVAPAIYGLHSLCALVLPQLGLQPAPQSSVELLVNSGWGARAVIAAVAVGLAPVFEESLFRGLLFPALRDAGWPRAAWFGTALLFGAIHGNAAAFLPLSAFGLFLAWLYTRTGNLLAPITAHMLFNTVPFLLVALGVELGP